MTKDVIVGSENYEELKNQDNVSHIYLLNNHLYCDEEHDPELHEVSTEVKQLK
jgi:hypothetical protein